MLLMAKNQDPVRERILMAALRAIDESGTGALRVVAVAHAAGVSQGMIRYYFGDRQGLVDEALARRFSDRFGDFMDVFAEASRKCTTPDEFRAVIKSVLDAVFIPERTKMRLERNSDVGEAVARPELAAKIAVERDGALDELRAIISDAQARGLMRKDLDPKAVAGLHLAMVHGYSMLELGERAVETSAFNDVYARALFALIFD
jgi:AcrR family transcriptional regulator